MREEWHVADEDLAAYAAGDAGPVTLASIETHLMACETCRLALAAQVHGTAHGELGDRVDDRVWAGIVDRVDRGGRLYTRSSRLLHVSLSSPPLATMTLLLASLLVVFVAVARLGDSRHATTMLVSLGPLVPLLGARVAFGRKIDPAGTMAGAAPLAAGRVASTRALVVTTIACLAGVIVSPLTTLGVPDTLVWLLPALALSSTAVAVGTYVDSTIPTIAFAAAWLVVVGAWLGDVPRAVRGASVDGLATAQPAVQAALLVVTVAAAGAVFVRRDIDPNWRTL